MNRTIAVVVTYNRRELLVECLDALEGQEEASCDILVVDNASTDGTEQLMWKKVQEAPERIFYDRLSSNSGGAGGFNAGMRHAAEMGYAYIWVMDDDTIVHPDTLKTLLDAAEYLTRDRTAAADRNIPAGAVEGSGGMPSEGQYGFGFLSSRVLWTDGSECLMNRQTLVDRRQYHVGQELAAEHGMTAVRSATFVSLLFPRQVVMDEGLPMKEYFIWGDDKEYTLRLSSRYDCYCVDASVVTHKMKENRGSSISEDSPERVDRYYYAYRNDLATARRLGSGAVAIYLAAFFLNVLRVILRPVSAKGRRIGVMFRGLLTGIFFRPDVEYVSRIDGRS